MRREAFKFWDWVRLIFETLWYVLMNEVISSLCNDLLSAKQKAITWTMTINRNKHQYNLDLNMNQERIVYVCGHYCHYFSRRVSSSSRFCCNQEHVTWRRIVLRTPSVPYWTRSERIWKTFQISGLDIKACPGHVDLVPGHIKFCGYVPGWAMIFQSGHVLIFSAVHISFAGLVQILAGHIKKFAGHVNF